MPEISRFYGIVIQMFVEAGGCHHRPHFHAYYQGHVGIYGLDPIERMAGSLPRPQERLVRAWARTSPQGAHLELERVAGGPATVYD